MRATRIVPVDESRDAGGVAAATPSVHCERDGRRIDLGVCVACAEFRELVITPLGAPTYVRCLVPEPERGVEASASGRSAHATPVRSVMTAPAHTLREGASPSALLALFVEHDIGCAPVVDEAHRPVAVVTRSDLLRSEIEDAFGVGPGAPSRTARPAGARPRPTTVRHLGRRTALVVHEDAMLSTAVALMARERVSHLPVVGAEGRVVGVLSACDVVRWLAGVDGEDVRAGSPRSR